MKQLVNSEETYVVVMIAAAVANGLDKGKFD